MGPVQPLRLRRAYFWRLPSRKPSRKAFISMANVWWSALKWGDEGKARCRLLSLEADIVVRFQGGHNAGHTLVIDDKSISSTFAVRIVRPGKLSIIGQCVSSIRIISWRKSQARGPGHRNLPKNLKIAENVTLILALHRETRRPSRIPPDRGLKIGTTSAASGLPMKTRWDAARSALMDLAEPDTLIKKSRGYSPITSRCAGVWLEPRHRRGIRAELDCVAPKILPYMDRDLGAARQRPARRQAHPFRRRPGALLDIDHGTYPFVTSSNTVAAMPHGLGPWPQGDRLCARNRQGLYDTGRRRPRFRRNSSTASGTDWRPRPGIRDVTDGAGVAAGLTRCSCGKPVKTSGIDGSPSPSSIFSWFRGDQGLRRLSSRRRAHREIAGKPGRSSQGPAIYETIEGGKAQPLARAPGRAAGAGDQYVRRIEELIEAPVALLSTSPERADNDPR